MCIGHHVRLYLIAAHSAQVWALIFSCSFAVMCLKKEQDKCVHCLWRCPDYLSFSRGPQCPSFIVRMDFTTDNNYVEMYCPRVVIIPLLISFWLAGHSMLTIQRRNELLNSEWNAINNHNPSLIIENMHCIVLMNASINDNAQDCTVLLLLSHKLLMWLVRSLTCRTRYLTRRRGGTLLNNPDSHPHPYWLVVGGGGGGQRCNECVTSYDKILHRDYEIPWLFMYWKLQDFFVVM